ncbi:hypothetical protein NU08_2140 [Flavobacterium anhuiense]|uniref:Uncharacterized protein n=1 Tax=Flavobacterium anhuiense TaxID=459526 RepID=A0A444VZ72_9FLAO|nr:hypothetical protein NU08_2140 [Flavobacterium anhuiense]
MCAVFVFYSMESADRLKKLNYCACYGIYLSKIRTFTSYQPLHGYNSTVYRFTKTYIFI